MHSRYMLTVYVNFKIYASITGYGQTGPYRNRAGYDVMVEACVRRL